MRYMKEKIGRLLRGWLLPIVAAAVAALAGNLCIKLIPWPAAVVSAYEERMDTGFVPGVRLLWMTLILAPLAEEWVFRRVMYGWLRRHMRYLYASVLSSLAFGLYHGNWIQGSYAFLLGMVLAWGYEGGKEHKFVLAAVMHGAANLAALAVFG